jgi:hypothetical protein
MASRMASVGGERRLDLAEHLLDLVGGCPRPPGFWMTYPELRTVEGAEANRGGANQNPAATRTVKAA